MKAHPNYHFHFTPTSSSWLNAVENWFSRLERKGLQRKAFQSVKQLREHLRQFIVTYNKHSAKPFVWKKPAQQVLDSVERAKQHAAAQTSPTVL
ncbi:MAG: transposase [Akkermansia sp.]|nr:transposase [Akkermansia sp.]